MEHANQNPDWPLQCYLGPPILVGQARKSVVL